MTNPPGTRLPTIAAHLGRAAPSDRVLTRGPAYEASRTLWNGAVTRRPAAVLVCTDPADVQAGVRAARDLGVPMSVRAGGHGWTGSALAEGGLTLDLTSMRRVSVDADTAAANLQGGATAGDLAGAVHPHGMVAVTGTVDAVGMVGLSLGGGYGPLSGRFGLAVDNVLSLDVVLADGSLVTADAEHEPELFWAMRGGGGNFGVVTSMRVRLHTVPAILTGMIVYPLSRAAEVLAALHEPVLHGPDELTVQFAVLTGPTGEPGLFVLPTWCGDPSEGERAVEPLTRLGDPLLTQVGPAALTDMLAAAGAMFPPGRHVEIRPRTVPGLTPGVIDALAAGGRTMTSQLSAVSVHGLHGAAARVPAEDTAFAARTPHLMVENVAQWEPADADAAEHRGWARDLSEALAGEALPGGYVNLLAPDEADQIAHAYGPNRDRLLAAKTRYDPDGVFSATPLP
ncbi:FAD-binding oxidoreductase [Pseudonocardia acaciae]|uniref:FAD-binding oxidoreductase n=1 Tax=Pseudonocardia acaciae TaxID=551276 RepID=UPI00048C9930|nr:FAD-binding oxidoreductase [Pseudonocardia acaciae]